MMGLNSSKKKALVVLTLSGLTVLLLIFSLGGSSTGDDDESSLAFDTKHIASMSPHREDHSPPPTGTTLGQLTEEEVALLATKSTSDTKIFSKGSEPFATEADTTTTAGAGGAGEINTEKSKKASGSGRRGRTLLNGSPGQLLTVNSARDLLAIFEPKAKSSSAPSLPFILDHLVLNVRGGKTTEEGIGKGLLLDSVAVALGRTRESAKIVLPSGDDTQGELGSAFSSTDTMKKYLFKSAPSWYVVAHRKIIPEQDGGGGEIRVTLRRKASIFTFAVTGGSDKRAQWAEYTWGRRTPVQWYDDAWGTGVLRPVVDVHPMYKKDMFKYFTFKISRIWQRVFEDYGPGAPISTHDEGKEFIEKVTSSSSSLSLLSGGQEASSSSTFEGYDWYVRLWDDNYFLEENMYNCIGRLGDPKVKPMMAGKMAWRYLSDSAIFPFAGGGAGWFLSRAGMQKVGPTMELAEKWFVTFRARKDIYLPHFIHDEDVFLTAWFHLQNITFRNIPGLEHVSPGMRHKQRCVSDETLKKLRWDPDELMVFDYPAHEEVYRIEEPWYAFWKPIVWHYMSPTRLVHVESVLYADQPWGKEQGELSKNYQSKEGIFKAMPLTAVDSKFKKGRTCYSGFPSDKYKVTPVKGKSIFEKALPDPTVAEP